LTVATLKGIINTNKNLLRLMEACKMKETYETPKVEIIDLEETFSFGMAVVSPSMP
jgi:hypothetical protein